MHFPFDRVYLDSRLLNASLTGDTGLGDAFTADGAPCSAPTHIVIYDLPKVGSLQRQFPDLYVKR